MGSIEIRLATERDAEALSILAARTFNDTFGPHTPTHDMVAFVAETYTVPLQRAEIEDPQREVLLAEERSTPNEEPILAGYAYLRRGKAPAIVTGPSPIEIQRLYIDRPWHGRGVAHALMEELLRRARAHEAQTVWLGVWEHNIRAQRFYAKYGFTHIGEHLFPVGTDPQMDWILARSL